MRDFLGFVLVVQLISATASHADEASLCAAAEIDMGRAWYKCLEFLDERLIDRYPALAERSDLSLTLIATNSNNRILESVPGNGSFYLVAHFPEFALSIVTESGNEWRTRHIFNHRNGQFLEVSGWPSFSHDGEVVAFFGGDFMNDEGILAIHSFNNGYIKPMAVFHTLLSWFTAVSFQSNEELHATMGCRELVDLPDVGEHWVITGQTEEVSFHYNGGVWRPSILKKCAIDF
jgi:hypothetical protein